MTDKLLKEASLTDVLYQAGAKLQSLEYEVVSLKANIEKKTAEIKTWEDGMPAAAAFVIGMAAGALVLAFILGPVTGVLH